MTQEEKRVELVLQRLKLDLKDDYYNCIIHDYFDNIVNHKSSLITSILQDKMMKSDLF